MVVTATIEENLLVTKTVTVDVDDNASTEDIEQAVRNKAYEKLVSTNTGWEIQECFAVDITIFDKPKVSSI